VLINRKFQKLFKLLAKKLRRKKFDNFLLAGIIFSWLALGTSASAYFTKKTPEKKILGAQVRSIETYTKSLSPKIVITIPPTTPPTPTATPTPIPPTSTPTQRPKSSPTKETVVTPTPTPNPQYTAQKINDVTWKVSNVQNDSSMASAQDIFNALNSYRSAHGASNLSWDNNLASFAQGRADLFNKNGSLDSHAGFTDYMKNDGFSKAGFNGLGENSAYLSGPMSGERIIKDIFGADGAHDGNQLDPSWTHAGVGVNGNAVNVNFGKGKR
jgi:uncharacterized protein YkwD